MSTLYARPAQDWPVLGLKGQHLGTVEKCALDTNTGEIQFVLLQTAWQTIEVEWLELEFDEEQQSFKLIKPA